MADDGGVPAVNVRFIHAFCEDVGATRAFYGERIGMTEQSASDTDQWGWAVYQSEGVQLMFHRWDRGPLRRADEWPWQPGDGEGSQPNISLGVHVPESDFADVVTKIQDAGDPSLTPDPTWRQDSYWGWTVKDPGGNTVELYTSPEARPSGDPPRWSG